MKSICKRALPGAALGWGAIMAAPGAHAGPTIAFGEDKSPSSGSACARYANTDNAAPDDTRQQDAGVNRILDGYNAQLGALYSRTQATRRDDRSKLVAALQLQY